MAGIEDLVAITITEPPPSEAAAGYTQIIRGTATFTDKFAAPPFVYAELLKKDWYKPEILEKTWHERGFPMPPDGKFEIEWTPDTKGHFEVTVVATPAPLSLPVVGVFPITGRSDTYKVEVGEAPEEEERTRDFIIVSYSKNGGPPVAPPGVLELDVGDRCRVNISFGHTGPAISGKFHAAIGNYGVWGFDEVLNAEKGFTAPSTAKDEWKTFEDHIDILITSGISPGDYSLYAKMMGITGDDVFTPHYENVIRIVGVAVEPEFRNLRITAYDSPVAIGETCRVHVQFEYQGPSVSKELYAAIGNYGFWGFDEILHGAKAISVPETQTWQGYEADVDIYISSQIDPAGSPYDLYAKINGVIPDTISPTLENVIAVTGVAVEQKCAYINPIQEGGHVEGSPEPNSIEKAWFGELWCYDKGTRVDLTAIPDPGYKWVRWSFLSEVANRGINPTYMYMTEDRGATARVIVAEFEWTGVIPLVSPEGETLPATDIIHDSATLTGRLIDTSFWSNVDVYFEWGETTAYGMTTPKIRMYEGQEGSEFYTELLHYLTPGTTYHFRAVVEAVGPRSEEVGPGYGQDMSFTTKSEVVAGFTMRVINPPAGAAVWKAGCVLGGVLPHMPMPQPMSYVWEWPKAVDDVTRDFFVWAGGPEQDGFWPTIKYHEHIFRLRNGKNYLYDWSLPYSEMMREI